MPNLSKQQLITDKDQDHGLVMVDGFGLLVSLVFFAVHDKAEFLVSPTQRQRFDFDPKL